MGSVDLLLDAPAIPRVLRLLMDSQGRTGTPPSWRPSPTWIACAAPSMHSKQRASSAGRKASSKWRGPRRRPGASTRSSNFYEQVEQGRAKKLLFRGILNIAQYSCLVHFDTFVGLMEAEGFVHATWKA